jgi:uncharacterized membrane protein (UPF0127 family)
MPKASAKKIKSARKGLLVDSFLLSIFICALAITGPAGQQFEAPKAEYRKCTGLTINDRCFSVDRADTAAERKKGLSERSGLSSDQFMLFTFDQSMTHCMWMKDMHFSIDIIWLNENNEIIKILSNVLPSTYPNSFCAEKTRYVLEMNAGQSSELGLTVGQVLDL